MLTPSVENEIGIRIGAFFAVFVAMSAWERIAPLRGAAANRIQRDLNNLGLLVIDVLVVRLLFPAALAGVAIAADSAGFGLANVAGVPVWLSAPVAIVLLDAAMYGQHVLFHAFTPLWRMHRVHHTDLDLDVTTAVRFHPAEILLSFVYKAAIVAALGLPAAGVMAFEILLNGTAMFNHANVGFSPAVDRLLRRVVVTPRMHWVHHSVMPLESQRNFGFCLTWWDRAFGTYKTAPDAGYTAMCLGVKGFGGARATSLLALLRQPLQGDSDQNRGYEIRGAGKRSG